MVCNHCGLGHETSDCRANKKMKAQFNKTVKNDRPQKYYNTFSKTFLK